MAVADDAVNPAPPPSPSPPPRIVVGVLALVCFALPWVLSAICAAAAVAHLVWGQDSALFVFLLELAVAGGVVCGTFFLVGVAGVLLCGRFRDEFTPGSCSEFKKSAFGASTHESSREWIKLPRGAVLGLVGDLPFVLLIGAGILVRWVSSPVDGSISEGEMIGSAILDLGLVGTGAISFFVIIPALALDIWRKANRTEKTRLAVADC